MKNEILDHTLSSPTGHFLYIDPTGHSFGDQALLTSPSYKGGQPRCLHLWYHLKGAGQGMLQIQQQPEIGNARTLWIKMNDQGNDLSSVFRFLLFYTYF